MNCSGDVTCQRDGVGHHVFRVSWWEGESYGGVVEGEVYADLVDEGGDVVE